MNILISNDDGIFAPGIKALATALSKIENVSLYVCAPDRQRSCIGHGLTLTGDMTLEDWDCESLGPSVVWAKACSGLPADCVRLALWVLEQEGITIDLVCTGINDGANTGSDINYSGTLAASREAVLDGVPSIAFSQIEGPEFMDNFNIIAPNIVKRFYGKLPQKTILNVNAPNIPYDEIKGYKASQLTIIYYPPLYAHNSEETDTETCKHYTFSYDTRPKLVDTKETSDHPLILDGYIAVTLIPVLQDTASTMPFVERLLED